VFASKNEFEAVEIRPAAQGRESGLMKPVQICLGLVNRIGWRLVGSRWPLLVAHIFVFRNADHVNTDPIQ